MRLGGFLGDGDDVGLLEAGFLKEAEKFAFSETKPDVRIEFAGLFEGVRFQIEDENLSAGLEDAVGFRDRFLRVLGVMKRLAEDGEIDGGVGQRN